MEKKAPIIHDVVVMGNGLNKSVLKRRTWGKSLEEITVFKNIKINNFYLFWLNHTWTFVQSIATCLLQKQVYVYDGKNTLEVKFRKLFDK